MRISVKSISVKSVSVKSVSLKSDSVKSCNVKSVSVKRASVKQQLSHVISQVNQTMTKLCNMVETISFQPSLLQQILLSF